MRPIYPLILLTACGGGAPSADVSDAFLPALGGGSHDVSAAMEKMAGKPDGLDRPSDLDFNPERPDELWIVNKDDDSVTILFDAGLETQTSEHLVDPYAVHFMEKVTSIAFGAPGTFGTCQDGDNSYNDSAPGNGFTGPTLWSSDLEVFAQSNEDAVQYLSGLFGFHTDLGSHLDMLHESPECMGIAWEKQNVYWVFDGFNASIARYDFHDDHGPGYDDHSDGVIEKWVSGKIKRKPGVVSHLHFDHQSKLLYIADTGNNRIAVLDTTSGREGDALERWEPGTQHYKWVGADMWTLVEGSEVFMEAPAGLAVQNGVLYVTDNGTSRIYAFELDGTPIDFADTGLPEKSLAGIEVRGDGEIWFADQKGNAVYRLTP